MVEDLPAGGDLPALAVGTTLPRALDGHEGAVAEESVLACGHWLAPALRQRLAQGFGAHVLGADGPVDASMRQLLDLSQSLSGRINVMMVLGPQARGGRMLGRWPGLSNEALKEGADLAATTDYRLVLAELMAGHMKAGI